MESTPWQTDRDNVEETGRWPDPEWGPFYRHTFSGEVHRDGGPECNQNGTSRRVYVFDPDTLDDHERIVARWAIAHPAEFAVMDGAERRPARGDTYRWGEVNVLVTRVARDGSWADIWCTTGIFSCWSKRQPLPFPDDFVVSNWAEPQS